jgi:hypothetical protein
MIILENTEVMNFEGAIRGMRNPLNSWDKSDSYQSDFTGDGKYGFCVGTNDLKLMQSLIKAGSDHRKFMRQILVSVDITAPLYWWKEFDTYKVGTVANSCSTMHKIHSKPIELTDFSVDDFSYPMFTGNVNFETVFRLMVTECEFHRRRYLETKDIKHWRALIQLLPESYNQRRTVTLNYENIRNMYGSRNNHKLTEWSVDFMKRIDSLPYAEELIKYN